MSLSTCKVSNRSCDVRFHQKVSPVKFVRAQNHSFPLVHTRPDHMELCLLRAESNFPMYHLLAYQFIAKTHVR